MIRTLSRMMLSAVVLVVFTGTGCSLLGTRGIQAPKEALSEVELEKSLQPQLKLVIREALLQTQPHYKNLGGSLELGAGAAFTGNYDWHSAVHAHWALLSLGRVTADSETRAFVLNRLKPDVLLRERRYLDENPDFEMPYGRVWLLQLLVEMSKQPEVTGNAQWLGAVRGFQNQTEKDVLAWLVRTRFPDAGNFPRLYAGDKKFRGEHYSWFFAYLFLKLSESPSPEVRAALESLARSRIEPVRSQLLVETHSDFDFLEVPALLALHDLLGGKGSSYACDRATLSGTLSREQVHRAGAYILDAWPCALAASKGSGSDRDRFQQHLAALVARPDYWREDFKNIAHWVPQFIWMGMWLRAGRP